MLIALMSRCPNIVCCYAVLYQPVADSRVSLSPPENRTHRAHTPALKLVSHQKHESHYVSHEGKGSRL